MLCIVNICGGGRELRTLPKGMNVRIRTVRDLGAAIRDRRRHLGYSQQELARRLGVNRAWVGKLEAGTPGADVARVLSALDILGMALNVRPASDAPRTSTLDGVGPVDLDEVLEATRRPVER